MRDDTMETVRDPVCGMTVDPAAGKPSHGTTAAPSTSAPRAAAPSSPPRPTTISTATDPVCGMAVDRASARHMAKHEGARVYFCSAGCQAQVRGRPRRLRRRPAGARADAGGHDLHLPDAPGDRAGRPRRLPDLRHGARAEGRAAGRRRPEPGARRLPPPLRGRRGADRAARRRWRWGRCSACRWTPGSAGAARWIELVLATPVVLWCGWPFLVRGGRSFRTRNLNMFSLIAIGVAAAYGFSVVATVAPGLFPAGFRDHHTGQVGVYFEAAAVIVVLVLLGQILELRARERTGSAIRALLDLAPPTARVIRADGSEEEVPLAAVAVGDRLRVRPGEKVPVDGTVVDGRSSVDESDADRRAGAGREGRRRPGDRRHAERQRQPRRRGDPRRQRHAARPHRRDGRLRPALARADPARRRRRRRLVRAGGDRRRRPRLRRLGALRPAAGARLRARLGDRGADHRLPLRARPRHADVDHDRDRPRRAGRRPDPRRRGARGASPPSTPSSSTRPAR